MGKTLPFISEFKTEQRIIWSLYVFDFFIIATFFFIGFTLQNSVHSSLRIVFVIYNIFIGIMITRKSRTNPKKRIYEAMMIMLSKDNKIYKPVFNEQRKVLGDKNV